MTGRRGGVAPGLRGACGFLTVVGGAAPPSAAALRWFGPVGWLLGATVALSGWGAAQVLPVTVAAGLALAVDLWLTGMLHLDGLADSADGLLPPLERQRRLAIMRTPDVGAFGVGVVVVVLLLRWSSLAAVLGALDERPGAAAVAVGAVWGLARGVMVAAMRWLPDARAADGGGLASLFGTGRVGAAGVAIAAAVGATAAVPLGVDGAVTIVVAAAGGASVLGFARRRVGGYTGDVLGATGMLTETVGLVALSALLA